MIRRIRVVVLIAVIAIIAASVFALLSKRADSRRRALESHDAIRKTVEFLKPDTTSELRFGKQKSTPATTAP